MSIAPTQLPVVHYYKAGAPLCTAAGVSMRMPDGWDFWLGDKCVACVDCGRLAVQKEAQP